MLHTAYWTGSQWQIRDVTTTDHNYDHGELSVEPNGSWRITGPFINGPQPYGTGGEVGVWTSQNQGASWQLVDQLTQDSLNNHTYVRVPAHANDEFSTFWADGNAFAMSASRLYFAKKDGTVYRMPTHFTGDFAAPILVTDFSIPDPDPSGPAVLAYDGLDYPNDGPGIAGRTGGSGWSSPWTDIEPDFQHLKHTGTILSSPASPFAPVGGWLDGKGGAASRTFNGSLELNKDGGAVFVSFLLRKDLNGGSTGDNVELALADGTTQIVRVGSTSDDRFYLGISVGNGQADVGDPISIGESYFVVLKVASSATGNDVFSASFYDHLDSVPESEPAQWDLTWATSSAAVLDTIRLALGSNATGGFDEFRLGTSWDDVAVAAPSLDGDFNSDGRVDAADYITWRKGLGTTYMPSDYNKWRANFGATLDGAGAAAGDLVVIPEPTSWPLLLSGLVASSLYRPGFSRCSVPATGSND